MNRISDQTKGLVDDVKEWVDLRIKLLQIDIEERLETVANQAVSTVVVICLATASIFFGLVAAAIALGQVGIRCMHCKRELL